MSEFKHPMFLLLIIQIWFFCCSFYVKWLIEHMLIFLPSLVFIVRGFPFVTQIFFSFADAELDCADE